MVFEVYPCCRLQHHDRLDECLDEFIACTNRGVLKSHFVVHRFIDDLLPNVKCDNGLLSLMKQSPSITVSPAKCPKKTGRMQIQHLTEINIRGKCSDPGGLITIVIHVLGRLIMYLTNFAYSLFDVFTLFLQHSQVVVRTCYAEFCS